MVVCDCMSPCVLSSLCSSNAELNGLLLQDNLPNLWAFTRVFPSLTILHLREAHWSQDAYTVLDMADLDSISLILSQPSLAALLVVLRKTSVLELRISDVGVAVQMRWTRFTKEEDFVMEAWSMGGENNL